METCNLFSGIVPSENSEIFETLLDRAHFKLERIISSGQSTPPGEWYDQTTSEWVLVLSGRAGLLFEGETEVTALQPGDCLHIPAHRRHRVEWTDSQQRTIWLALHYE